MRGDFVGQTVPFVLELKRKILAGESILYTWNAGMGTNFIATLAYGLCSPFVLIFFFVPDHMMIKAGVLVYIMILLCMNATMIYYLTHRPEKALDKNDPVSMVLSLAYTMCAYMVSFMDVWYYLSCSVFLPLVLLGLEQYIYQRKWKLYVITLFAAFLSNYYLTGLFCIFIILYYFTMSFKGWKHFLVTSYKILLLSAASILASSAIILPTIQQLRNTSATSSAYQGDAWYTTFWDEIQFLFSFQQAGFIGSSPGSYGDNQIYFGIFPLMLTSVYFLLKDISGSEKIKKGLLLVFYFLAFDLNILNYVMHLGHYPNYYPNRFSIFFTLLCIVLAGDAWHVMGEKNYRNLSFGKTLILGFSGVMLVILCFVFATRTNAAYSYYLTISLCVIYMLGMIVLPYFVQAKHVIYIVAMMELVLNFAFMLLTKEIYFSDFTEKYALQAFMNESDITETGGFSKNSFGDVPPSYNQGLLCGYKDLSFFSSSMTLKEDFFQALGFERTTNGLKGTGWNPAVLSMLNIEYQVVDWDESYLGTSDFLYSDSVEIYHGFDYINRKDNLTVYRNPTVLNLGYMIDPKCEDLTFSYSDEVTFREKINEFVSTVGGCGDVLTKTNAEVMKVESDDCIAAIIGNQWVLGESEEAMIRNGLLMDKVDLFSDANFEDSSADPYLFLTYRMPEAGYYYAETSGIISPIGYAEEGEVIKVYLRIERDQITPTGIATGWLEIYKYQEDEWRKAYQKLSKEQLVIEEYDSSHIIGTVDASEGGLLFTSIPYDDNWHLYVDGNETEITPLWNGTFVSAHLDRGVHSVVLRYRQKWLVPGVVISILMFGCFVFGIVIEKKKNAGIGK